MDKLDPDSGIGFFSVVDKVNEIITFLNRRHGRFKPPTPQEVESYAKEYASDHPGVDGNIAGRDFCDFYESKGWKVGKTKMKCWQAAVRKCVRDGWCKKIARDRDLDEKKLKEKAYYMQQDARHRSDYTPLLKEQSPENIKKFCKTHPHLIWLVNEVRPDVMQ